ncbi:hypothetical protein IG631_07011 [Alternaria alternata]|nr:hypothetical protein IG631_07011 [Alternaria alternata]
MVVFSPDFRLLSLALTEPRRDCSFKWDNQSSPLEFLHHLDVCRASRCRYQSVQCPKGHTALQH